MSSVFSSQYRNEIRESAAQVSGWTLRIMVALAGLLVVSSVVSGAAALAVARKAPQIYGVVEKGDVIPLRQVPSERLRDMAPRPAH